MPTTTLGKWSVGLNIVFLGIVIVSVVLVKALGVLDFGDRWWDVTVPVAFLIEMAALYTGIRAVRKSKERLALVYFSIVVGIVTILFALLHSLFIGD